MRSFLCTHGGNCARGECNLANPRHGRKTNLGHETPEVSISKRVASYQSRATDKQSRDESMAAH